MLSSRRGFTLIEMLVVIGIIAVLAALLLPAVMMAVTRTRTAAIGTEIAQVHTAVESYKTKHLEYPPNFRDYNVFIRHVRKCYSRVDPRHLNQVIAAVWGTAYSTSNPPPITVLPNIDEGESLVLWLHLIDNDAREPFKAIIVAFGLHPTTPASLDNTLLAAGSAEKLFPFKEERFVDGADADFMPSYKALYAGDTAYLYIDSRSYMVLTEDYTSTARAAYAEDPSAGYARPYWSQTRATTGAITPPDLRDDFKAMNPTTFQIICAGLDGEFGFDPNPVSLKFFPAGGGYDPSGADNDNMTNFSEGRWLEDHIP